MRKTNSRMNQPYVLFPLLIWMVVSIVSCATNSFKEYKLSDGRVVLGLRNIEDVYPVYAATYKSEFDLTLKLKEEILDTTIGGKHERDIKSMYETLDRLNMDTRNMLTSGYSTLLASLSVASSYDEREKAMERWDKIQQNIVVLTKELRKINQQSVAAQTKISSTEWDKLINQVDQLKQKSNDLEIK